MAVQRRRTPRPTLDKPWRNDFSTVPAEARRAARYTLQLVANRPECLDRLEDPDFTGALWALCLPLIDPAVLSSLQATWEVGTAEDASDEDDAYDIDDLPDFLGSRDHSRLNRKFARHARSYLDRILRPVPAPVLARLALQDGQAPTHPGVTVLAECVGLSDDDTALLDFAEKRGQIPCFATFLRELKSQGLRANFNHLAAALNIPLAHIKQALHRRSPLRQLALLRPTRSLRKKFRRFTTALLITRTDRADAARAGLSGALRQTVSHVVTQP